MVRRASVWLVSLLLAGFGCGQRGAAQSNDELFQQAFGKRTAQLREMEVELEVDGSSRDTVPVTVKGTALRGLVPTVLAERLEDLLDRTSTDCLAAVPAGSEALTGIAACGITLHYEPAALKLRAEVPASLRREQVWSVRPVRPPSVPTSLPAHFSTYLNLGGTARRLDSGTQRATRSALALDGALRWGASTFEYDAWCAEGDCSPGLRSLVFDQPQLLRRWRLGDLPESGANGLGVPQLRGLALGTSFALAPMLSYTPDLDTPLELSTPSTLEVLVNGRVVQRVQLPAGRYSVRDFPLAAGNNAAELRLTDAAGRQEIRSLEAFVDLSLLDAGRSRFGLAAGRPILPLDSDGAPATPLVLAGEYAMGIGPRTTLSGGAAWIDALDRGAVNFGITRAMGQWLVAAQAACSVGAQSGCRGDLRFRRAPAATSAVGVWHYEGALGWRQAGFADVFGAASEEGSGQWLLRASRSIAERYSLALGTRGQWTAAGGSQGSLSALFGGRVGQQASLRLGLERSFGGVQSPTTRVVLSFTLLFDHARQSLQWDIEAPGARQTARWQLNRAGLHGGFNAALATSQGAQVDSREGSASYRHERFSTEVSLSEFHPEAGSVSAESRLSLRSALAFVDGQMALGERVLGGFAIVRPHDPVAAGTVYINPVDEDYLASSRGPGPALVSGLRPYEARALVLALPELAPDHDPGELFPVVQPGYKGGVLIQAGGAPQVRLQARILGLDGAPLAMVSGQLETQGQTPIPVFAGRGGVLRAAGLSPGQWQLVLQTQPPRRHAFQVTADSIGVLDLGDLTP